MAAHFLLELMAQKWKRAKEVVNGSLIVIDRVRRCKDAEEIRRMRQCVSHQRCGVGEKTCGAMWMKRIRRGQRLSLKICGAAADLAHGCRDRVSFEAITAFGANCADPHHANDGTLGKPGDSVVLDIGGRKDSLLRHDPYHFPGGEAKRGQSV